MTNFAFRTSTKKVGEAQGEQSLRTDRLTDSVDKENGGQMYSRRHKETAVLICTKREEKTGEITSKYEHQL